MQRKKNFNFALSLFLLLALAGIFIAAYRYVHQPMTSIIQKDPVHALLIVDLNNNKKFVQEDLQKGEDAILVVRTKTIKDNQTEWFSSLAALIMHDINKDNRIDARDPIFSQLALLYYPGQPQQKYVSLKKAHIKAIVIDKTQLVKLSGKVEQISECVAGHVEFTNGKTRKIKVVAIKI